MQLEFRRLKEINRDEIVALHTNPLVRRQLPLVQDRFDDARCKEWVEAKERQWDEYGYGPWAFIIDGRFAGWGGLQYEHGDADLGLVLHPDHWGRGRALFEEIIRRAFGEMGLASVTVLLPPTRKRVKGLYRLGFVPDGEVELDGVGFTRYRLRAPRKDRIG